MKIRITLFCVVALFLLGCSKNDPKNSGYLDISKQFHFLETDASRAEVDEVLSGIAESRFSFPAKRYMFGEEDKIYWYKANIPVEILFNEKSYLEIPFSLLDNVEVWFKADENNHVWHYKAGRSFNQSERTREDGKIIVPIPESANSKVEIFIAIKTKAVITFSAVVWRVDDWDTNENLSNFWLLLVLGGISVLMLYNLFLALSLREASYLYYVLYLFGLTIINLLIADKMEQFGIPITTNTRTILYVIGFTTILDALFINKFLNIKDKFPKTWRYAVFFAGTYFLLFSMAQLNLLSDHFIDRFIVGFITIVSGVALIYYLIIAVVAYVRGATEARFVILAFIVFLVFYITFRLYTYKVLEYGPLIIHFLELATLLEGILLSFALADKINLLSIEKERIENATLALNENSTKRIIDALESEKEDFSNQLYNDVGKNLVMLEKNIDGLINNDEKKSNVKLEKTLTEQIEHCDKLLGSVRTMSHELHPHLLKRLGLRQALESYIEVTLSEPKIDYQIHIGELVKELDEEYKITIYRLTQFCFRYLSENKDELNEVIILLNIENDRIKLVIKDDGDYSRSILNRSTHQEFISNMNSKVRLFENASFSHQTEEVGNKYTLTVPYL